MYLIRCMVSQGGALSLAKNCCVAKPLKNCLARVGFLWGEGRLICRMPGMLRRPERWGKCYTYALHRVKDGEN